MTGTSKTIWCLVVKHRCVHRCRYCEHTGTYLPAELLPHILSCGEARWWNTRLHRSRQRLRDCIVKQVAEVNDSRVHGRCLASALVSDMHNANGMVLLAALPCQITGVSVSEEVGVSMHQPQSRWLHRQLRGGWTPAGAMNLRLHLPCCHLQDGSQRPNQRTLHWTWQVPGKGVVVKLQTTMRLPCRVCVTHCQSAACTSA